MFINDTNYLDQHFLIDQKIIDLFYKTIDEKENDIILEIGPGKGVITNKLENNCKKLIVVEKDKRLSSYLKDINALIIYEDILNYNIPRVNKIVTSLPYSITDPFIYKLIDVDFDKLIMICGKKLYDSILKNNTKLSILVNLYFNIEHVIDIKPESFNPAPKTMSSLITFSPKDINSLNKSEQIIRLLYKYRYMKVKNALKEILIRLDNITQNNARQIVKSYNIDDTFLNKLFDELSNEEVVKIREVIHDSKI
ncbi:MAG: hypothetical protein IJ572_01090 [Bacilli bacterium]|nr:hypothetical protein [Bacilli bacterium]